jgi:hypothetical protein
MFNMNRSDGQLWDKRNQINHIVRIKVINALK